MIRRLAVAVVLSLAAIAVPASAQTITLTPSVIQLAGRVGQSTTQRLTLGNSSSLDLAFDLQADDVLVRDHRRVFVPAAQVMGSIAATAVFSPKSVVVPAGQARTVNVTVTVPDAASPRAILVRFQGTTRIKNGSVSSTASLGALLTFTLSTRISVRPDHPLIRPQSASSNTTFEQGFDNDGDEVVTLGGVVVILNSAGVIVGKSNFEAVRALPGEHVLARSEFGAELPAGRYRVLFTFDVAGKALTQTSELVVR
jgi:hypothetical protein